MKKMMIAVLGLTLMSAPVALACHHTGECTDCEKKGSAHHKAAEGSSYASDVKAGDDIKPAS